MPTQLDQLLELLDRQTAAVRRAFVQFVRDVQSPAVIAEVIDHLQANDMQGAFKIVDSYIARFANVAPQVFNAVGVAAAAELDHALEDVALAIAFDPTNPRAAALIADSRARLMRELSAQQQASILQAVARVVNRGGGTQEIGRAFRDSIGLTTQQEAYVASYREQLSSLDSRALDRALRDSRYDSRLNRAISIDRPLTQRQIDTMVDRYRARAVMARADTIARTEALTGYSQARDESLRQMMQQTRLNSDRVLRVWHATHDDRVRDWHLSMEGQRASVDEPFIDGLGNAVMYPGDPSAPPETRINCRCTLGFEVLPPA